MLSFATFAFTQPWLLLALAGLPVLWLLLRITPPAPRSLSFPAINLLFGLRPPEETPARTPLWLIILRMFIAALIILGLARPVFNPTADLSGSGPLVLVIDDGWAAARHWAAREAVLDGLLVQAQREGRSVILLSTAPDALGQPPAASNLLSAAEARRLTRGLQPKPWPVDRAATLAAVDSLAISGSAHVVWLSDGLDDGNSAALADKLQRLGRLDVLDDGANGLARLLLPPEGDGTSLIVRLRRPGRAGVDVATILANGEDGGFIARATVTFAAGEDIATARIDLPIELRNRIARLSVEGEASAGAVMLLDERWRRRPVGLIAAGPLEDAQPLLSELYYLQRALEPFTELHRGPVDTLLQRQLAIIVLPDAAPLTVLQRVRVRTWVESGGLLLRFAGPRLAKSGAEAGVQPAEDPLLPVRLRGGGRSLSGVLTWDKPARLAPFPDNHPLAGLSLSEDVLIQRQVLAEPTFDLREKTWARLSDGTPLVTAARRGEGWVVLIHTTANNDWSNLPLSGLFVEMLRRIVAVSQGIAASGPGTTLPPIETLDGFGRLGPPAPTTLALDDATLTTGSVGPRHPPGYYGAAGIRRAHNLASADPVLIPISGLPSGVNRATYSRERETDLKPWLLSVALVLGLIDLAIALVMRGLLGRMVWRGAAVALLLAVLPLPQALAQTGSATLSEEVRALEATLQTHLAYVVTGVPAVDEISRAGLDGLTRVLQQRTSIEAGRPLPVDLARDELAFFPLLYWAITPEQRDLSEIAVRKVNTFLRTGGTILFDLREPGAGMQIFSQTSRAGQALRRLTRDLEIPPLVPVPPDHVLTKAFYLMQDFPGRFASGTLWLDSAETQINDGVASVLIGSNDWAGAWATNEFGQFLKPVVPGGERQREMAFRFGVNLAMYAMTGNYKADQVHIPFILERLGQ